MLNISLKRTLLLLPSLLMLTELLLMVILNSPGLILTAESKTLLSKSVKVLTIVDAVLILTLLFLVKSTLHTTAIMLGVDKNQKN